MWYSTKLSHWKRNWDFPPKNVGAPHGTNRWFLWNEILHGWFLDFWDGGGNHRLKFQNPAIGGFWENMSFVCSNGWSPFFCLTHLMLRLVIVLPSIDPIQKGSFVELPSIHIQSATPSTSPFSLHIPHSDEKNNKACVHHMRVISRPKLFLQFTNNRCVVYPCEPWGCSLIV